MRRCSGCRRKIIREAIKIKNLKFNLILLRHVFRSAPIQAILLLVSNVLHNLRAAANIWLVKLLFDNIEQAYAAGDTTLAPIFLIAAVMAGIHLLTELFNSYSNNVIYQKLCLKVHESMHENLYRKALELDLKKYDDPAFYNDFIWAIRESDSRAVRIYLTLIHGIGSVIGISGISAVLLTVDWIFLPIVFGVLICTFILENYSRKAMVKQQEQDMPYTQHMAYINRVFYLQDYVKELRTSAIGAAYLQKYDEDAEKKIKIIKRFAKIYTPIDLLQTILCTGVINGFVIIYTVYKIVVEKSLTLGGFAVSVNAMQKLYRLLQDLVWLFADIRENGMYAEKFCTFIAQKPDITDLPDAKPLQEKIRSLQLEHLTFSYPGSDKKVLDDINLTISQHEKIAFVGYNGAGKTTLIKLLTRLYVPTDGQILVNGKNIQDYKTDSYRKSFGTVFQDFQIFSASIAENVINGPFEENQRDKVLSALRSVQLQDLKTNIETTLTREFDDAGINLSGGETQKIAIARVFAGDFDFIILDEPSSALDPVTEYELNKTMMAAAYNKTVIFISHRLSTTRMADRIYMFENGKVIESGNHEQLMALNGKYAKMFQLQAQNYQV